MIFRIGFSIRKTLIDKLPFPVRHGDLRRLQRFPYGANQLQPISWAEGLHLGQQCGINHGNRIPQQAVPVTPNAYWMDKDRLIDSARRRPNDLTPAIDARTQCEGSLRHAP